MKKYELISEDVIKMYKNKMTCWEIASEIGVDYSTVKMAIDRSNCEKFSASKLFPFEEDEICNLYREGFKQEDLALKYKTSKYTILKLLREKNIKTRKRCDYCNFNKDFFKDGVVSEETAYVLGLLMSDGCIVRSSKETSYSVSISLHARDLDVMEKYQKIIDHKGSLFFDSSKNQYGLKVCSKQFGENLIKLKMIPNKSLVLEWPDISNEYLNHFVRGYFDGDGSFYVKGNKQKVIILSSENFCNGLNKSVCNELGWNIKTLEAHPNKITKRFAFGGGIQFRTFYKWLYKDASIFMNRKALRGFEAFKFAKREAEILDDINLVKLNEFLRSSESANMDHNY